MYGYEHITKALDKLLTAEKAAPSPCPDMLEQIAKWSLAAPADYKGLSADDVAFILINGYSLET